MRRGCVKLGSVDLHAARDAYLHDLAVVRRLSPATVRAYGADLRLLVEAALVAGVAEPDRIDLELLRNWLWEATQRGEAR